MSTSFDFPANPTLNQIVVLPDGNSAQWNGYAWVSVANNVTYPLEIPKGGTGATNPDTALTNLGGGATGVPIFKSATAAAARAILGLDGTIPWLLQDGTVAAPGLAWASEPGMGWYRSAAGFRRFAVGGAFVEALDSATAAFTSLTLTPRAAGQSQIQLRNDPTNFNQLILAATATGALITESLAGTATAKPLTLSFPAGVAATGDITVNKAGGAHLSLNDVGVGARTIRSLGGNLSFFNIGLSLETHIFTNDGGAGKVTGGTAWFVLSDRRAKKDIEDYDGGIEKILSLRPRWFTRVDTGERSIGCVADEAEIGFGELIRRSPGKIGDVEYPDLAQLYIDPLFWATVNAIKTLHARLEAGGL